MTPRDRIQAALQKVKEREAVISPAPWDPSWGFPGRYDGENLAHLRNMIPRLLKAVEKLSSAVQGECSKFRFPDEDRPELFAALAGVADILEGRE